MIGILTYHKKMRRFFIQTTNFGIRAIPVVFMEALKNVHFNHSSLRSFTLCPFLQTFLILTATSKGSS